MGWALKPITRVLLRDSREREWRIAGAQGRRENEGGGRDYREACTSPRVARMAGYHQKLGERSGSDPPSETPEWGGNTS